MGVRGPHRLLFHKNVSVLFRPIVVTYNHAFTRAGRLSGDRCRHAPFCGSQGPPAEILQFKCKARDQKTQESQAGEIQSSQEI